MFSEKDSQKYSLEVPFKLKSLYQNKNIQLSGHINFLKVLSKWSFWCQFGFGFSNDRSNDYVFQVHFRSNWNQSELCR